MNSVEMVLLGHVPQRRDKATSVKQRHGGATRAAQGPSATRKRDGRALRSEAEIGKSKVLMWIA